MENFHKQELLKSQIGSFVVNALVNAFFVWLLMRQYEVISLWGDMVSPAPKIGVDLIVTGFVLAFLITIISTPINNSVIKKRIHFPRVSPFSLGWERQLPKNTFLRSLVLGIVGMILGGIVAFTLHFFGVHEMTFLFFLLFKAILAGFLALLVNRANLLLAWSY